MNSIFNYQTLAVCLDRDTRTLIITFNKEYLSFEVLFELESILAWTTNKIEIKSILLNSSHPHFCNGHELNSLRNMSREKLEKFSKKLQKINYSLQCMSQTVICDLGLGAKNIGVELAMACDIRLAESECKIELNHTKIGLIPCSGGIAILSKIIGSAHAKNWILSGIPINENQIIQSGFVFKSYFKANREQDCQEILSGICTQSEVGRIQTKLGLSENNREHIEVFNQFENRLASAAMISEDWKEDSPMPAKNFATAVKMSLIKNQEEV